MSISGTEKAQNKDIHGSSYAGIIRCDYAVLEEEFGTPELDPTIDFKINCEWDLVLIRDKGKKLIFTIYSWKEKDPPKQNLWWHVGSHHENDDAIFAFLTKALRCEIIAR